MMTDEEKRVVRCVVLLLRHEADDGFEPESPAFKALHVMADYFEAVGAFAPGRNKLSNMTSFEAVLAKEPVVPTSCNCPSCPSPNGCKPVEVIDTSSVESKEPYRCPTGAPGCTCERDVALIEAAKKQLPHGGWCQHGRPGAGAMCPHCTTTPDAGGACRVCGETQGCNPRVHDPDAGGEG